MAVGILACTFDYLPHRPPVAYSHNNKESPPYSTVPIPRSDSEYTATCVTSFIGSNDYQILTWLLLYQNYHNIHHLVPYIPFYYYSAVWEAYKTELLAEGTVINPILYNPTLATLAAPANSKPIKKTN